MNLFFGLIRIRRNIFDSKYPFWLIDFFGFKFKFLDISRYLRISNEQIMKKQVLMSNNNVFKFNYTSMYLPLYPVDLIQRVIVDTNNFWEIESLNELDKYLKPGSIVADLGANIGNHTIYWGQNSNVEHIYSFEPVKSTFDILQKNIELNNLQNKIDAFNIGCSDEKCNAEICGYNMENIGGVNIRKSQNADMKIDTLDNILSGKRIDFMKIDVEGHECFALKGAKEVITKNKPVIVIESFENHYNEMKDILESYGYEKEKDLEGYNYIFVPKNIL